MHKLFPNAIPNQPRSSGLLFGVITTYFSISQTKIKILVLLEILTFYSVKLQPHNNCTNMMLSGTKIPCFVHLSVCVIETIKYISCALIHKTHYLSLSYLCFIYVFIFILVSQLRNESRQSYGTLHALSCNIVR